VQVINLSFLIICRLKINDKSCASYTFILVKGTAAKSLFLTFAHGDLEEVIAINDKDKNNCLQGQDNLAGKLPFRGFVRN
jgi:hypothetical protein